MDGCWKAEVLMEVHIHELRASVEREGLRGQGGEGKGGVRSLWRWGKGSGVQMKGLTLSRKGNPQPSDIRRIPEVEE